MTKRHQKYLSSEDFYLQPIYSCIHCRAHLASQRDLISKSFQGSQGRAYLFGSVVNVGSLIAEERLLLTGLHYVADIYCYCCSSILGWKYEKAFEPNQRYKEGKFIVEVANLIKDNCWDQDIRTIRTYIRRIPPMMYNINWDMSTDSLSKGSISRQSDSKSQRSHQSKLTGGTTSFIREFGRDLQHIFGRVSSKNNNILSGSQDRIPTPLDPVQNSDNISNSTLSTSIDRAVGGSSLVTSGTNAVDSESYLRMNSDEPLDPLANSLTLCLSSSGGGTSNTTGGTSTGASLSDVDLLHCYSNTVATNDNNSLNTSVNSTNGLLMAYNNSTVMVTKPNLEVSQLPSNEIDRDHNNIYVNEYILDKLSSKVKSNEMPSNNKSNSNNNNSLSPSSSTSVSRLANKPSNTNNNSSARRRSSSQIGGGNVSAGGNSTVKSNKTQQNRHNNNNHHHHHRSRLASNVIIPHNQS